ncbi:MAG: disulfide bond formation protein B, partial [Deinococcota bacterium]
PLVLLFGVASYRNDKSVVVYALPLSILGMGVGTYQYLDQKIPSFGPPAACSAGVPCSTQYINWYGFVTIPFLALTAFTLISAILIVMMATKDAPAREGVNSMPSMEAATD